MVGIPLGRNCTPLLADLSLYSYENEFLHKLIKEGKRKLSRKVNLSYCYIDDLIFSSNSSLISTPKNSLFLGLQNLLQLFLISTYFLLDMRITTLLVNYMTNVMCFFPYCELSLYVKQYSISTSLHLVSASQLICFACCCSYYSDFYHATRLQN